MKDQFKKELLEDIYKQLHLQYTRIQTLIQNSDGKMRDDLVAVSTDIANASGKVTQITGEFNQKLF